MTAGHFFCRWWEVSSMVVVVVVVVVEGYVT